MRFALFAVLALIGCHEPNNSPADAVGDGAVVDASTQECACCTRIPLSADDALSVASDGTTLYVELLVSGQHTLASLSPAGDVTVIDSAEDFVLAAAPDVLAYVRTTGGVNPVHEIHARTSARDRLLMTLTGVPAPKIAVNATDVLAFGPDTPGSTDSTLWHWSLAASDPTLQVLATLAGAPQHLALGDTVAVAQAASGVSVAIDGSSAPMPFSQAYQPPGYRPVFSHDSAFVLNIMMQTSHLQTYEVQRILPDAADILSGSVQNGDGFPRRLLADAQHLYVSVSYGAAWTLVSYGLDGNQARVYCAGSGYLTEQDEAHFYGLERIAPGQFAVDVLAK